jgi:micrococcal nuclease
VPFQKPSFRPRTASSSVSVAQASFVGSKIRSVYHKPTCKWAIKISYRNRVQFRSLADAKAAGYRACGVCSP